MAGKVYLIALGVELSWLPPWVLPYMNPLSLSMYTLLPASPMSIKTLSKVVVAVDNLSGGQFVIIVIANMMGVF